jgi:hypothetical protein
MKYKFISKIPLNYIKSLLKISDNSPSGLLWLNRDNLQWNGKHGNKVAGYKHKSKKDSYESWRMKLTYKGKKHDLICSRVVFLLHNGYLTSNKVVDHKDRDSLNNKVSNLREVSCSENSLNNRRNKKGV